MEISTWIALAAVVITLFGSVYNAGRHRQITAQLEERDSEREKTQNAIQDDLNEVKMALRTHDMRTQTTASAVEKIAEHVEDMRETVQAIRTDQAVTQAMIKNITK